MPMLRHVGRLRPGRRCGINRDHPPGARLSDDDLAAIDRFVPPGAASGTRYRENQMRRLNA
jgi:hypothetical protein